MADQGTRGLIDEGRDARRGRASLPFFARRGQLPPRRRDWRLGLALACLFLTAAPAGAQPATRPWLDWRTVETEHFVLHYPARYRAWTLALAERIEGVRAQVDALVGYEPTVRVHVVIDDPANVSNGYAFTALDAPTIVLWPTPPDPRSDIGNYRVWQELLATHEYAHVAHLVRPSRNGFQRRLWSLSPVPLGPIPTRAPRWVLEGYATYVEGRVSGTGRPNNAWRAAFLRQLAIEGRLPTYGQMSGSAAWEGGNYAYLVGSAYLEWLARRQGDSSIVAVWRRLTAVTTRSFDEAFAGVYGDAPAVLYARFSAEVTGEALDLERALRREGLVQGALVQRLTRTTGDPAVSPDGRFVALTIRHADAPSQLVVWRTTEEPDTAARRRAGEQRRDDPQDVPDRSFYPARKKAVITLVASEGAAYETPRWMADNRHLLVARSVPLPDGTLRSDLYVWSAEDGDLRRVTHGAGVRNPDPSPDGRWAAAVRCDAGWCDLVRVDLQSGAVSVIRPGSVTRNYYRPRVSSRTGEILVAEQSGDRWRIARVSPADGSLRYADPDDGVTRYDATWTPDGRAFVTTSEATGIANLERIDTLRVVRRLTSVTGAAVAADVAPDGALWFLTLHAGGYDLRRLAADSAGVHPMLPVSVTLADSLPPILPPRMLRIPFDSSARPSRQATSEERGYGLGPSRLRYVGSALTGYGGSSLQLSLVRSDPVGRFGVALSGLAGTGALPEGAGLRVSLRTSPTRLDADGWISHESPSATSETAQALGLDLRRAGGAVRATRVRVNDGGEMFASLAGLAERQHATSMEPATRGAGILVVGITQGQRDEQTRYEESLWALGEAGGTAGGTYQRQRVALLFGTAAGSDPLTTIRLAYGSVGGYGAPAESFVIGGIANPLVDPVYDARRVEAPAYPAGSAAGNSFASYRIGVPLDVAELYYAGTGADIVKHPLRSYGAEVRQHVAMVAALGTPDVDMLAGVARAVDEPAKGLWRVYVNFVVRP